MESKHYLRHRAVAAVRRRIAFAPSPDDDLQPRDGDPLDGVLPLPSPVPPFINGQLPSSLVAPHLPSVITPLFDPLPPVIPTPTPIPHTETKPSPKVVDTTVTPSAINSGSGTVSPSPVLTNTTSTTPSSPPSIPNTITTPVNTPPPAPLTVTQVVAPSSSTNSTTTSSNATSGGISSSGRVAAGVVVGLIGCGALILLLAFFARRCRRRDDDEFDAKEFRRSAVLMHDPPTHDDTIARGYNPRPPSMVERKFASSPITPVAPAFTHGNMYDAPVLPTGYYNAASYPHNQAFFPGPLPPTKPFSSPPPSPNSYATSYATAGHSQGSNNGFSAQNAAPSAQRQSSQPPIPARISRPASGNDPGAANGFTFPPRQGSRPSTAERQQEPSSPAQHPRVNDYVDLSRSSVTPFQAAQYEAISRKLNAGAFRGNEDAWNERFPVEELQQGPPVPPKFPLGEPVVAVRVARPSTDSSNESPPPVPSKSPFEDSSPESEPGSLGNSDRESLTSTSQTMDALGLQDFPVPPSPVSTIASRYRVDSLPPTLPELNLGERDSALVNRPLSVMTKRKSVLPKYHPSPLAMNSTTGDEAAGQSHSVVEAAPSDSTAAVGASKKVRPETVYDPEDAYGGI